MKYYAVRQGRKMGIFTTWAECQKQVTGFKGAEFKSFSSEGEARNYLSRKEEELPPADEGTLVAYVDGSFDSACGVYGSGAVLLVNGEEVYLKQRGKDPNLVEMRNVAGEIGACRMSIVYALDHGYRQIHIYYDYMGIEKWATGEWKANKDGTRAYKAFIDSVRDKIVIRFCKVQAHSNHKYNDLADKLAKESIGL